MGNAQAKQIQILENIHFFAFFFLISLLVRCFKCAHWYFLLFLYWARVHFDWIFVFISIQFMQSKNSTFSNHFSLIFLFQFSLRIDLDFFDPFFYVKFAYYVIRFGSRAVSAHTHQNRTKKQKKKKNVNCTHTHIYGMYSSAFLFDFFFRFILFCSSILICMFCSNFFFSFFFAQLFYCSQSIGQKFQSFSSFFFYFHISVWRLFSAYQIEPCECVKCFYHIRRNCFFFPLFFVVRTLVMAHTFDFAFRSD